MATDMLRIPVSSHPVFAAKDSPMIRQILTASLLSLTAFAPLLADDKKPNEPGFASLFDGKTLNGWTGAKDAYKVEDGAIVCVQGTAGNLLTEKEYADFEIRFEFTQPGKIDSPSKSKREKDKDKKKDDYTSLRASTCQT